MEDDLMHELSAAYALDALSPDEERAFEAHLSGCERCREDLAGFSETAAILAYSAPPVEPPPALRDRILDAAHAERPNVVPLRPRRTAVLAAAAAAAACAALGLGLWAANLHSQLDSAPEALPLKGANGSLVVAHGGQATLVVSGLSPAPTGKTYEAWVMHGSNAVRAGVFSPANGTAIVKLDRDVPNGSFVGVTLERAGGVDKPTGTPILTSSPA